MMSNEYFYKCYDFAMEVLEYMKLMAGTMNVELTPDYVNNVLECAININCFDNDIDIAKEYLTCAVSARLVSSAFNQMMKEGDNDGE